MKGFEFGRGKVAERAVPSRRVVEALDPFEHRGRELRPRVPRGSVE